MDYCSNPAPELFLDVHGVSVAIRSESARHEAALSRLREDLGFFEVASLRSPPELRFEFSRDFSGLEMPWIDRIPLFSTKMCAVHGWGRSRLCDYGDGLRVLARNEARFRFFKLVDPALKGNGEDAYEVAYTTLLSAIGESLDLRGFHRVHALGFELNGEVRLMPLPSGRGKSTRCVELLKNPATRIFSDEMPLVRQGKLYPFPIRIALRPADAEKLLPGQKGRIFNRRLFPSKHLFPIDRDRVASPARITGVELRPGTRSSGVSLFFSLIPPLVIGLGLTQMAEHMLRLDTLPRLIRIASSRLLCAWQLSRRGY
ncbi:MAG: hypothetical protein NDJ89_02865 [Oligoflexia bacterium]|nr:hypothetical protein [Oligoflexia bacterium]